jgi:hypothetical protein
MQELKLYDPDRRPKDWTDIIRPGQYAVFHSDLRTDVEKKPDGRFLAPGEESFCLVFDSLPEAEAYCEAKVAEIPSLRCDIYDHMGKSKPPRLTYVNQAQVKAPRRHAHWGWVLISLSVPCFWIEWHWHGTLIVPLIVGLNLVFAGLRLIYWGAGGGEKRRAKRANSHS